MTAKHFKNNSNSSFRITVEGKAIYVKAVEPFAFLNVSLYINRKGRLYIRQANSKYSRLTLAAYRNLWLQNKAAKISYTIDRLNLIKGIEAIASLLACDSNVIRPSDSVSRYFYINGRKVRISDHDQPLDYVKGQLTEVGGYDKTTGKRHKAADISVVIKCCSNARRLADCIAAFCLT